MGSLAYAMMGLDDNKQLSCCLADGALARDLLDRASSLLAWSGAVLSLATGRDRRGGGGEDLLVWQ